MIKMSKGIDWGSVWFAVQQTGILFACGIAIITFGYAVYFISTAPRNPKYSIACYDQHDSLIAVFKQCDVYTKIQGAYYYSGGESDKSFVIVPVAKIKTTKER